MFGGESTNSQNSTSKKPMSYFDSKSEAVNVEAKGKVIKYDKMLIFIETFLLLKIFPRM